MRFSVIAWPHEVLRAQAVRVERVTDDIRDLAAALLDTVKAAGGASLSAQQTGAPYRVFVVRGGLDERWPDDLVFINPIFLSGGGRERRVAEGCLSLPGVPVAAKRREQVTVCYLDAAGRQQESTFDGVTAQAVQHELEHLDGRLLIDHAGPAQRQALKRRFPKVEGGRAYQWSPREDEPVAPWERTRSVQ